MVTMAEVAARAGVSISTVSHVLNGTRPVSPALTARVAAAVEESGYSLNAVARSLATSTSKLIGIVMSATSNPFFAQVFSAMEDTARRHGFTVVLSDSHDDVHLEARQVRVMLDQQVSGIILAPATSEPSPALELLAQRRTPATLVDRFADARFDQVGAEGVEATASLVTHLAELGHERIGFVRGRAGFSTTADRLAGYRLGLQRAGLRYDHRLVRTGKSHAEPAYAATTQLLRPPDRPTALVSGNNDMTIGVLRALRDGSWRVPRDVAVVGYDDLAHGDLIHPGLTAIAQPVEELGRTAVELLIDRIRHPGAPTQKRQVAARFVHRQSCGCSVAFRPPRTGLATGA